MRNWKRAWALALTAALCLGLLSGCGQEETSLSVCVGGAPEDLDPIYAETASDRTILAHLYENLMRRTTDASGQETVTGAAARSYTEEANADGTVTYTFQIQGEWSDGRPVMAADFVFAWRRLADPANDAPEASLLSAVAGYDTVRETGDATALQVTAEDESTLTVVLSGSCGWFLSETCTSVAAMPLRQDLLPSQEPAAEGEAAGALFDAAGDGGAPARLSALEDDARLLGAPAPKTAREALAELLQDGCTLLPLLAREEVREGQGLQGEGTAAQSGYALFRGGRLAGMAREKEAHGMDLLLDRGEGRLLALSAPDGRETSLRLAQVRTAVRPVFQEGALTGLSVTCRIQAEVAELRGGGMDEALRSWLEAQAAREAGESIAAALALCQRLECDCLHLGPRAALAVPWEKEALKEQWPAAFAGLELQLDVQAAVARM